MEQEVLEEAILAVAAALGHRCDSEGFVVFGDARGVGVKSWAVNGRSDDACAVQPVVQDGELVGDVPGDVESSF